MSVLVSYNKSITVCKEEFPWPGNGMENSQVVKKKIGRVTCLFGS